MPAAKSPFTKETFQFLRQLGRNNRKEWMDEHRERYREYVVQPFRRFFDEVTPLVLEVDANFNVSGRTGTNFSRINRDIRFTKDKTLYKTQMYVKFQHPWPADRETGQLYAGLSAEVVTAGFRIYSGAKRKESALALIAGPRVSAQPIWVDQQKKRLARRYDSYWYSTVKGEWTKREGWPTALEDWKKLQAWIVRKKMKPSAALASTFSKEVLKIFKDLYPLLKFTSIP
jgi:uncharacterized protein (TIGR02453 family)